MKRRGFLERLNQLRKAVANLCRPAPLSEKDPCDKGSNIVLNFEIIQGDITTLKADAIVNAAKPSLLGGGGVDGTIHRAAGPKLLEHCRKIPEKEPGIRCRVGEVISTPSYDLPSGIILHTVGPIYDGPEASENPEKDLFDCYTHCLETAEAFQCRTVAFPAISCGAYGFPLEEGVRIAMKAFRSRSWDVDKITLVMFTDLECLVALGVHTIDTIKNYLDSKLNENETRKKENE